MPSVTVGIGRLLHRSQVFFFCSGATGLVYQVLWTRRLTLTFGHTVLAVSTVVTAFMAGLALGSFLAGRWSDRRKGSEGASRLLGDYALLEGFIGLWALLTLPLLAYSEAFYVHLASQGLSGGSLHLACFFGACAILIPPTTAMGATVPVLTSLLTEQVKGVGAVLARLYGVNTLGAFTGAALGGFVLLPGLGLTAAMVVTAACNLAIAVAAWRTYKETPPPGKEAKKVRESARKERSRQQQEQQAESGRHLAWLVPLSFCLAGAASMAYQVAWNRSLCLTIGSSVYAFSAILVVFLVGIGLGSLLYPRWQGDRRPELFQLARLYLAVGASGALTILVLPMLPALFVRMFYLVGDSFLRVVVLDLALVSLVLILPTLAMGLAFPLATAVCSDSLSNLGSIVGRIYSANTVGCILGAFLAGFVLVPRLGAQSTLVVASLVYLLCAVAVGAAAGGRRRMSIVFGISLAVALLTVFSPRWDTGMMAAGVSIYAGRADLKSHADLHSMFVPPAIFRDGLSSAVSFHLGGEHWDVPNMRVNGKVDASRGQGDRLTQYFLGYLPTLMHPKPSRVGVIGLGGGFTLEAVAQCPGVERIECAELEPAVVEVAEFWKPYNGRVLEDPRVKVHLTDGRTFVLADSEKFDVLISEPSNPWIAGIGSLFSVDFYEIARARLKPNGIMCQWFNVYAVSTEDMKMVLRGFFRVFPHGQVWQSSGGDLVLIGTEHQVEFDLPRIQKIWAESPMIQRHLFETQVYRPEYLAGHFLMSREQLLPALGDGPLNTDDRPLLEFSAPLSLYKDSEVAANRDFLFSLFEPSPPPGVKRSLDIELGLLAGAANRDHLAYLQAQLPKLGTTHPHLYSFAVRAKEIEKTANATSTRNIYRGCQKAFPSDPLSAIRWGDFEASQGEPLKAAELYLTALANPQPLPGSEAYVKMKLGECLLALQDPKRAVLPLLQSAELTPAESTPLSLAGSALLELQQDQEARKVLERAVKRNPIDPLALMNLASAAFNLGDAQEAEPLLRRVVELVPNHDLAWLRLGMVLKKLGREPESQAAFEKAVKLDPENSKFLEETK
jgi:spermidine synthase